MSQILKELQSIDLDGDRRKKDIDEGLRRLKEWKASTSYFRAIQRKKRGGRE